MEAGRVALIQYSGPDGVRYVGSGLLISDQVVLTADHVADGSDHRVDFLEASHGVARVLRSGTKDVDLAIIFLKEPIKDIVSLRCARVDQTQISQIYGCVAVGFPRWKKDGDKRRSAQIDGTIPTGEGFEATVTNGLRQGFLTLAGNRGPSPAITQGLLTEANQANVWGGMSGSVVLADGLVIGVVRSVNLADDGQSLTVTPITAINNLPDPAIKNAFWTALSVSGPDQLPMLPLEGQSTSTAQREDYQYDVYVSYWPGSFIEPWVRNRFLLPLGDVLLEELGRQPSIVIAKDNGDEVLNVSRVMLAILSKQYFSDSQCRAAFESMLQRQADEGFGTMDNPVRLVHAVIAHDLLSEAAVPLEYRGMFHPINFRDWAYDFEIQDWQTYKLFNDAVRDLASTIAEAVNHGPPWRTGFPQRQPIVTTPPTPRKPTL